MRKIFLFWLLILCTLHSFGQDCSGKITQSQLDYFNSRILRNCKKANYCPIDSIVLIDIIDVGYPINGNLDKTFFEDGRFLSDIFPSYYRPKGKLKKVIDAYAILFNESKDFVVLVDYFGYYDQGNFDIYCEMAKLIVQNQIKCVYHLAGVFWGGIYIGIGTDGLVFLLNTQCEHVKIWNLKEFPADEWSSIFSNSYLEKRGIK
jgi:hypothetical protein